MASGADTVWAIDIGSNSLKALHLGLTESGIEVLGFDNIAHGKVIVAGSTSDVERDELIALSFHRFIEQHNVEDDEIIISVPSQNSFARFVTLPPVDEKRIPEIVKFEAEQQIPFDINEVQWDWQLTGDSQAAERKVGIFAIKNEIVDEALRHFEREAVSVGYVQLTPMALYNYIMHDRSDLVRTDSKAVVIINIGAENTDLVVCTKSTVWQRCIPMGGNSFTTAISNAFKINLEKSEKLKRTAPMSKYARQILQVMKPVFTELASEMQRSLGFYSSSHPNVKLAKIVAFGGGTRMRGLLKYLQQSLQIPVERPDSFKKLTISEDVSAAKFHENVCDFAVVYGLGVQVLGLGVIESNLLPVSIAKSMAWASKGKYFIAAALLVLFVSLMCLGRANWDRIQYSNQESVRRSNSRIITGAQQAISKLGEQENRSADLQQIIRTAYEPFKYRDAVVRLHQIIIDALVNEKNNPEQAQLYRAFDEGRIEDVVKIPRKKRKQLFITGISIHFVDDVGSADFSGTGLIETKRQPRKRQPGPKPRGPVVFGDDPFANVQSDNPFARRPASSYSPRPGAAAATAPDAEQATDEEEGAGFVVTISGFSPYKNIGELLDPVDVDSDPNKWGFVSRLVHLNAVVDGNSPFKLYRKTETKHFKRDYDPVDLSKTMPEGIGVISTRIVKSVDMTGRRKADVEETKEEDILIDPMTKEIISKVARLDKNGMPVLGKFGKVKYDENDHWFTLKMKFVWRKAPAPVVGQQNNF